MNKCGKKCCVCKYAGNCTMYKKFEKASLLQILYYLNENRFPRDRKYMIMYIKREYGYIY